MSPQISACPQLRLVEEASLASLPATTALTIAHNPALVYFHPAAVSDTPALASLGIVHE